MVEWLDGWLVLVGWLMCPCYVGGAEAALWRGDGVAGFDVFECWFGVFVCKISNFPMYRYQREAV